MRVKGSISNGDPGWWMVDIIWAKRVEGGGDLDGSQWSMTPSSMVVFY